MLEEDPQSSHLCVGAGRKDERGVRGVDRSVARAEFSLGHQVIAHNSKERARAGLPLGGTTKCTAVARLQPVVAADDSGAARCGGRTPLPTLSTYFFFFRRTAEAGPHADPPPSLDIPVSARNWRQSQLL